MEIDEGRRLVAVGYDSGSITLWRTIPSVIDEHPAGWEPLWERKTHAGPVADIRVSEAHIVSGSMADRTVYIYALADDGSAGAPMALHRTFECEGMTDGVRDDQARSMLEPLRDSQERSS